MAIPILLEILAILDFLVQSTPTRSVQDSDYAEHRKEILTQIAEKLESRLTTEEIKERLLQQLRAERDFPNDILDLVLQQGTKPIRLDSKSRLQVTKHTERLVANAPSDRARRSRRARSIVPDTAKRQKRALSVTTSGSLRSCQEPAYSSRINKKNAVSKLQVVSKVMMSTMRTPEMLTWIAKTQNKTAWSHPI